MAVHHYLACDLGAESGRVILGTLADAKLHLREIHRFPNNAVIVNGTRRWDVLRIYDELQTGIRKVDVPVESLSCDSWGVDYVWLKDREPLLTAPYQYRDNRTDGALERAAAVVSLDTIFAETGIQFMPINTLYQLHADPPWLWKTADRFLNIGDYFNYLFSGVARAEESLASTTQLYNPRKRAWSTKLIRAFGFKRRAFPEVVPSGTILGTCNGMKVIATCSHDTGAAVAAVPASGSGWAYLSSGTWSLLGIETDRPILHQKSRQYNFTNEIGYGGRIRYLKNIVGLWILQECRRAWGRYDYPELMRLAEQAPPLKCLINPNDERFAKPDQMPEKIAAFCRHTGQPVPETEGETVRCILESLALLYRRTLDQLEDATGQSIHTLHIVGGGSKNTLLNQFSADATGRTVHTGPVEATATGNILIQAIALGHLTGLEELRQIVRNSFDLETYRPRSDWQSARDRFRQLCS
jgi:rhamnulokinase